MAESLSNRARALRSPATHIFIPGRGFIDMGEPLQLLHKVAPTGRCNPPIGTKDKTFHSLVPPGGHPPINFQWLNGPKIWMPRQERPRKLGPNRWSRMGYEADYLSQAGWTYGQPAVNLHQ